MAESKNNKPKTEKTSASVTSTLPRLCPTSNFCLKDTSCNIPKLRNRFQGNREIFDEKQKPKGGKENLQANFKKKFTEFKNSDKTSSAENASILQRNYHSQIPVRDRHSLNILRMPPTATRSQSPPKKVSAKEKFSNKVKIITLDQNSKKKKNAENSRSSSPIKAMTHNNNARAKQQTPTCPAAETFTNSEKLPETKRIDTKRTMSTKITSKARKSKDKSGKELQALNKDQRNSVLLKQTSQPSLSVNDKIQPQEKISLDQLKSEVYEGDRTHLSFEKVHLCFKKSIDNLSLKEKKSYFVKYTSENARNQKESSLTFLQNISSTSFTTYSTESDKKKSGIDSTSAIKTISGHELILTSSMKLDIEKEDIESEDLEISEILQETTEKLNDQKKVVIPQDDANEYDSEVSTDGELVVQGESRLSPRVPSNRNSELHRTNDLWKSREAEMLSDVDYRQSVYHPAVSRRHEEFMGASKSIEDNFNDRHSFEDRNLSLTQKTSSSSNQTFSNNNEKSWITGFDKTNEKSMYNSVIPAGSFYGMRKIRTKKERVSGALLHFTLKMIRLLAIFNLWPGDNCHMLTSQSLKLAS